MQLKEIIKKLQALREKGFITAARRGDTAVGYLFEQELGANESNIPIPDVGGRVELKGTRKKSSSLITLFTFNRGVWRIDKKELIRVYGYTDEEGRDALYSTVSNRKPNQQGFYLVPDFVK